MFGRTMQRCVRRSVVYRVNGVIDRLPMQVRLFNNIGKKNRKICLFFSFLFFSLLFFLHPIEIGIQLHAYIVAEGSAVQRTNVNLMVKFTEAEHHTTRSKVNIFIVVSAAAGRGRASRKISSNESRTWNWIHVIFVDSCRILIVLLGCDAPHLISSSRHKSCAAQTNKTIGGGDVG